MPPEFAGLPLGADRAKAFRDSVLPTPTRANPLERNNVFNTYSDNLAYANSRGGLAAVIDMAVSDAYNAGKPGVGKAAFAQPSSSDTFAASAPSQAQRLSGDGKPGAPAPFKPFTLGE